MSENTNMAEIKNENDYLNTVNQLREQFDDFEREQKKKIRVLVNATEDLQEVNRMWKRRYLAAYIAKKTINSMNLEELSDDILEDDIYKELTLRCDYCQNYPNMELDDIETAILVAKIIAKNKKQDASDALDTVRDLTKIDYDIDGRTEVYTEEALAKRDHLRDDCATSISSDFRDKFLDDDSENNNEDEFILLSVSNEVPFNWISDDSSSIDTWIDNLESEDGNEDNKENEILD